jgi:hypothetical protein
MAPDDAAFWARETVNCHAKSVQAALLALRLPRHWCYRVFRA